MDDRGARSHRGSTDHADYLVIRAVIPSWYGTSPWSDEKLPRKCLVWVDAVDEIMWRDWCLTSWLAGWDRDQVLRYWRYGYMPEKFVEWFAEKYDLIRFN